MRPSISGQEGWDQPFRACRIKQPLGTADLLLAFLDCDHSRLVVTSPYPWPHPRRCRRKCQHPCEANPYAGAQALRGLALLCRGLPRVKADPSDLAARLDCQIGSWLSMGPLASGVPMGASHGIGYVLGAVFDVPHGHTSCIMLPAANALEQASKRRAPGTCRCRDGLSGRGCRRGARLVYRRARHAAQPWRRQVWPRELRAARRAGNGHPPGCRATRGRSPAPPRFERSSNWPPKPNALAGPGENLQWTARRFLAAGWLICVLIGAD